MKRACEKRLRKCENFTQEWAKCQCWAETGTTDKFVELAARKIDEEKDRRASILAAG